MKINIDVPDGISGNYKVESFKVPKNDFSQFISSIKCGRSVPAGTYKRLMRGNTCVMSNTPDEISDFRFFVYRSYGSIIINGLGLGVLLKSLLNKDNITEVIVIEKSFDVINLVAETYTPDKRVSIINADALEFRPKKGKRFNFAWHDIWDYICADNIEEMKKLHRKYGRLVDYQESWCRKKCEYYRDIDKKKV